MCPMRCIPNLSKLTSLDYSHQYYVDGPSTVVDAFFASDSCMAHRAGRYAQGRRQGGVCAGCDRSE